MPTAPKNTLHDREPARVLAFVAVVVGIIAAAINADAWWFLLGLMAFVLMFAEGQAPNSRLP